MERMQSFTLDLRTLLQILCRQKQHGLLQAEITSDKLRLHGARQTLQASILLEHGVLRSCSIVQRQGERVAEGQVALNALLGAGIMEWHWEAKIQQLSPLLEREVPRQQSPIAGYLPSPTASIPRRTVRGEGALPTLPREYRKILALVDGQRSVHKLASILSIQDEEVVAALQMLRSWGLIF